jgi:hypothetical protein
MRYLSVRHVHWISSWTKAYNSLVLRKLVSTCFGCHGYGGEGDCNVMWIERQTFQSTGEVICKRYCDLRGCGVAPIDWGKYWNNCWFNWWFQGLLTRCCLKPACIACCLLLALQFMMCWCCVDSQFNFCLLFVLSLVSEVFMMHFGYPEMRSQALNWP